MAKKSFFFANFEFDETATEEKELNFRMIHFILAAGQRIPNSFCVVLAVLLRKMHDDAFARAED